MPRKEGSTRTILFGTRLDRKRLSGRVVAGILDVTYDPKVTDEGEMKERIRESLGAGRYRLVLQRFEGSAWMHVDMKLLVVRRIDQTE